jgi:thiol:disulfide interchange protein DsbD
MKNLIAVLCVIFLSTASFAQLFDDVDILQVKPFVSHDNIAAGSEFFLAVKVNIKEGYHINSNTPSEEFLIPTVLKFMPAEGMSFGKVVYPPHKMRAFSFSKDKIAVYENEILIFVHVSTSPQLSLGAHTISTRLSYQACDEHTCFAPSEKEILFDFNVVSAGMPTQEINGDIFSKFKDSQLDEAVTPASLTADELKAKQYIERGLLFAVFTFFSIGLALNLTPCVYPVIPLTVSYFGGQSQRARGSSFVNALFYLFGIAIAFSFLGLLSGLAGKQWGFLFQSPWFVVAITVIILAMSASLFGAFEITVPSWLLTNVGGAREGVIGAFIMGLTAGVVIAPCAAGIITGLVGLVAKLGLVVKGTFLFFVMGLGLGLPYLILATFSGLLNKLPQSGVWMVWVRKLFGLLLVAVALYFLLPQLERVHDKLGFLFGLLAIFGGLLLGFLDHSPGYTKAFKVGRAVFGVLIIVMGIVWTQNALQAKPSEIDWVHYDNQTIQDFLVDGKPVFMDFYADWCAPCKQLDRETFTDERVIETAKSFTMIKVDCTAPDAATRAFMNRYQVVGMPTLIFLSASGRELEQLREIGFVGPDKMLQSMQEILEAL